MLKDMNENHTIEDIPIIMISSDDSEAFIRKAYELGASDYISRPFDNKIVYRRATNTIKLYAKQRRLGQIVEFRNGECGIFNPLLLQCLVDIQDELRSELKSDFLLLQK